jgi:hypothetical protein
MVRGKSDKAIVGASEDEAMKSGVHIDMTMKLEKLQCCLKP